MVLSFLMTFVPSRFLLVFGLGLVSLAACGDNLAAQLEVSGMVYEDRNANGVFDQGEGIAGWAVTLINREDGQDLEVRTDQDGRYLFEDIAPGKYGLSQEMQDGWRSAPQGQARIVGSEMGSTSPSTKGMHVSHIIGGSESLDAAYPFMVSVGDLFNERFYHFCGGVLIADQYVLTAAHCSEEVVPADIAVSLATNDPESEGTVVTVSKVIVHPQWQGDTSLGFDIALWKLSERVDMEALGVNTVTMLGQENRVLAEPGVLASTLGWGVTDIRSSRLQEVHLPVIGNDSCGNSYPRVDSFDTQICAGLPQGGLDSCQGDSGGPLLVRDHEANRWLHAGVTSWGQGCAVAGFPGIYGRSSALSEWALAQIHEPSQRGYQFELNRKNIAADFGNSRTTRELVGDIGARWGMAALIPTGVNNGVIRENTNFSVSFALLEDPKAEKTDFACSVDRDGDGPLEAAEFACQVGANEIDIAGYEAGSAIARIIVRAAGRSKVRDLELTVNPAPVDDSE